MKNTLALPEPFKDLEDFLSWAQPTETARRRYRESLSLKEIQEFYDAMLARTPEILDYFRSAESKVGNPDEIDRNTKTLFTLMLAFACASLSIEVHKSPTVPDGMPGDILKPEHEAPGWKHKPAFKLFPRES